MVRALDLGPPPPAARQRQEPALQARVAGEVEPAAPPDRPAMRYLAVACCSALSLGCAASAEDVGASALDCMNPTSFRFVPDTGDAAEAYLCFGFDAGAVANGTISGVRWSPPDPASAYQIHHALLYAIPSDYPDGPFACDGTPAGAVALHMWSRVGRT
jgi:hypothetical protein